MAVQSFEVMEIKCIDRGDGDPGVIFIGKNKMVTLVLDRGPRQTDLRIARYVLEFRNRPFTIFIQAI